MKVVREDPKMITTQQLEEQLKNIGFNYMAWGRTEARELPHIILSDEEIYECVNGIYEGGFALLVATSVRVLLVDKKPLNYLTVEDLRFDMISEIDFSQRLIGARINISTGSKNLNFFSLNQQRLRKLIGHVQNCMAEVKIKQSEHQEGQKLHLEELNQQMRAYLLAQHRQQQRLRQELKTATSLAESKAAAERMAESVRPSPELSDYLLAQNMLAQNGITQNEVAAVQAEANQLPPAVTEQSIIPMVPLEDLYAEGRREVFGKPTEPVSNSDASALTNEQHYPSPLRLTAQALQHTLEVNPLRIASSKLPMAMRNRKFGRPSFHAHSQAPGLTDQAGSAVEY